MVVLQLLVGWLTALGLATLIADFSGTFGGFTGLTLGPQNLLNANGSNATGNSTGRRRCQA